MDNELDLCYCNLHDEEFEYDEGCYSCWLEWEEERVEEQEASDE